jgi:hypothetical protein
MTSRENLACKLKFKKVFQVDRIYMDEISLVVQLGLAGVVICINEVAMDKQHKLT